MESIIAEVRNAKQALLAGNYELAYTMMQNVDDELTQRELAYIEFINKKSDCTATIA